ncbi:OmpA family protein [Olleya sp. HaHaR_3_96]|uniref:OmpA family protein n=1 Tax=Olleya sp. HaHaR_3_96 TaxID=2745560 RepID=UPI001C4F32AA|nr:OmpA family protein [Olleya sp. HaHaR_3_96]QXP60780.1 PD40 domain-containing protein [Olleya sp. HaHaR_3_96]
MRNKITLYITLFFLSINVLLAQEKKEVTEGNKEFDKLAYIEARESYLKAASDGVNSDQLLKNLGDSYYFNADYKNAAKWYGQLFESSDNIEPEYIYRYALSLKSDEKYLASDNVMEKFNETKGEDYRANLFVNERNYLEEIELQSGRFELINVHFNSKLSDFAPSFYQGTLIYSSNRNARGFSKRVHDWNEQPFLDLYKLNDTDGSKPSSSKFSSEINSIYHESTAVFTKDDLTMYFTRNNYTDEDYKQDEEGTNRLKLYRAKRADKNSTDWDVQELPFNSDQYSVAHPALSPDGKTLYFASDMPGSKGFSDLYKVEVNNGAFGEIKNLGDKINTEGRETFPFISKDNKLYFASDGHVGLGGLDIFVSDLKDNKIGDVFNLGRPVNGPDDDFTFIINNITGIGYFASNRAGGVGDDDIYSFKSIKPLITKCEQSINGIVLDVKDDQPIANAVVYLLNENNKIIDEKTSRIDGSFSFTLDCSQTYSIRSTKEAYSPAEKVFNTPNRTGVVERALFMKKQDVLPAPLGTDIAPLLGINIIYFDLDKAYIRQDAEVELRKIIDFLNVYSNVNIDVRSHTDSRNTSEYNLDLSNRRAKSTIDYLVTVGGINSARLTGQGYGETQLRNRCSDGTPCSESEHQLNRRSEFIIVK